MRIETKGKGTLILAAGIILPLLLCGCSGSREGEVLLLTDSSRAEEIQTAGGLTESSRTEEVQTAGGLTESSQAEEVQTAGGLTESRQAQSGQAAGGQTAGGSAQSAERIEQGQEPLRIKVYVCGAVKCPGVVELPEGSRAEDALRAAGGFGENAAREAVNLAAWVLDGQQLYFPEIGEEAAGWETIRQGMTGQEATGQETAGRGTEQGLVNINTADLDRLCTLPGIGPARAADIVAYREKNGGFSSCSDIMKVSGIKNSVYEKICDKITVK